MPELRIRALLLVLLAIACCRVALGAAVLKPVSLTQFFLTPSKPAELRWTVAPTTLPEINYRLLDYWGQPVTEARAKVGGDGALAITVKLPAGYYELTFPDAQQTFGVCATPAYLGPTDSFFGIDSALSWLVSSEKYPELIAILKRCGISISRERMNWGEVAPAADECNLQTKYTTVRELYRQQGLPVLELFHDAPRWAGKREGNSYPQDQLAVARSWGEIGKNYSAGWEGLEIWNEPDLSAFAGEASPDQYVPMVKAINYSFRQAGITTPLGGGVFSTPSAAFLRACAQNGLLDNVDFISFHNYGGVLDVEEQVARYRAWLRENGKETLPLWITECGKSWKRGPERPPLPEDAMSALDITMKAIEARACGVARHFPFVFPFYEEREANFGMLGKECTPLRSMAAYAYAVRTLAFKQFFGDLHSDDPALRRARVFTNGQQALIVLYTGKPAPGATVKVAISPNNVLGIDGRPLRITTPGVIPIPDGLCYLSADLRALGANIHPDCPAMQLNIAAHQAPPPLRSEPSPIILSYRAQASGMAPVSSSTQGYWVGVAALPQFPVHIRVSNLSTTTHLVTLHWQASMAGTRDMPLDGPALTVPPLGKVDADWSVDLSPLAQSRGQHLLLITATAAKEIPAIAPLALPLTTEMGLAALLKSYPASTPLLFTDLTKWQPLAAADAQMATAITVDKHWLLTVTFGKSDPWAYPQLQVPAKAFAKRQALLIRAKCANPASVRVILWQANGGAFITSFPAIPADGQWHTAELDFDQFVPMNGASDENGWLDVEQITKISLGMNSPAKDNALEVSDLYVVGDR